MIHVQIIKLLPLLHRQKIQANYGDVVEAIFLLLSISGAKYSYKFDSQFLQLLSYNLFFYLYMIQVYKMLLLQGCMFESSKLKLYRSRDVSTEQEFYDNCKFRY